MSFMQKNIDKEKNIDNYTTNKNVIKIINACFNLSSQEMEKPGEDKPIKYNIIALGNSDVGKTNIFQRLSKDIFSENNIAATCVENYIY